MAVTIREVAKAAGVSASTVSRALANSPLVDPDTREQVLRAADELGYLPNRAARGLITGRTGNLGLILPDLANPYFPEVVKGIQARASEADYAVFLVDTDEDRSAELPLVRALAKQVDGIILCSPRMSPADLRMAATYSTVVAVNRRGAHIPAVTIDNAGGMRQVVAHLLALSHKRIGYVGGPRNSWSNRERLQGIRAAAVAAGIELVEIGNVAPRFDGGEAAAEAVADAGVTAVIAYNDLVALGLTTRLTAGGVAVPREVSVVGVDDIPMSGMFTPALTTVAIPKARSGRAAVDLMLRRLGIPADPATAHREIPTELIVRDTTATAPTRRRTPRRLG